MSVGLCFVCFSSSVCEELSEWIRRDLMYFTITGFVKKNICFFWTMRSREKTLDEMKDKWWRNKSDEIQTASDSYDTKWLFNLAREVYHLISLSVMFLHSTDGKKLVCNPTGILKRWQEHFDDLLNHFRCWQRFFEQHLK